MLLQVWDWDRLGGALLLKAQKLSMTFGQVWLADPPSAASTETRTQWRFSPGHVARGRVPARSQTALPHPIGPWV